MIEVELPDGSVFEVETTDPEIARLAAAKYLRARGSMAEPAPFTPREEGAGDTLRRAGEAVQRKAGVAASGFAQGLANLIGLPQTLDSLPEAPGVADFHARVQAFSKSLGGPATPPQRPRESFPSPEDVRTRLEPVAPRVQPEGALERVLSGFGELAGSAPFPAGMVPAAVGGVTGEAARRYLPGVTGMQPETAEMVGRLGGPLAVAGVQAVRRTPGQMIHARTRDVTPEQWAAGEQAMVEANKLGLSLMGPEALAAGGTRRLASDVRAHPTAGGTIDDFLAGRPDQLDAVAARAASSVGPARDPSDVATTLQRAAEEAQSVLQQRLSGSTRGLYGAAENTLVPDPDVQVIVRLLQDRARNASVGASRELLGLAERIAANPTVGAVSREVKSLADRARSAGTIAAVETSQAAKEANALAAPALRQAETTLEATSPSYAAAQDIYRAQAPQRDALTKGRVGQLSTARPEEVGNVPAMISRQQAIIVDPGAASPNSIRTLARQLNDVDPTAFRDWTAEYLRRSYNAAAKNTQAGDNPMAGANWIKTIAGTDRDRANLRAVIEESARASGQSPDGAWAGFLRVVNAMQRTGTVPGVGSQTAGRSEAYRVGEVFTRPMAWVQQRINRGAFEDVARIFTDPDSVRLMRQIAVTGPNTGRERALFAAWENVIAGQE